MASLLLGDLNDYIEPSQACVLPPTGEKPEDKTGEAVSINLTDCLACSGCITSAETVLVAQQTYNKLLEAVDSKAYKQIVISISPQSVASLAVKFKLSTESTWRRLNYFFKSVLGVDRVLDTTEARGLTHSLLTREFLEWKRAENFEQRGPLIVSACPGWVCYAEKRYSEFLPLLSRTRSPQQMAGVIVKYVEKPQDLSPADIFHCTVMPCFDKKLEASREEFLADVVTKTREVDTVITTTELVQILQEKDVQFSDLTEDNECANVSRHSGSGSGGYLEYVLEHAPKTMFPDVQGHVKTIPGRNSDFVEYQYVDSATDKVLLRFVAISGFRNIQTFVIKQKKPGKAQQSYDFVEIMACPAGCINGGGQIKPEDQSRSASKEHSGAVNQAYRRAPLLTREPPILDRVLNWIDQDPEGRSHLLKASYKAVEENASLKKVINAIAGLVKENPALLLLTSFLDACRHKREKVVDVLCNHLKDNSVCSIGSLFLVLAGQWRTREQDDQFPLITAAEMSGLRLVSDLLKISWISNRINLQDDEGNTALHYSVTSQTVQLLLDTGSDRTIRNSNQETCLLTTASFMQPHISYVENHKKENWPSHFEFTSQYLEVKRLCRVLKAFVLRGLDPYDMTERGLNILDMVLPDFHVELIEALEMRMQVDREVAAIEAELELGPDSSYLAWLPSSDLSDLLVSYIRQQLEDLIAFNWSSL